MHLSRDSSWRMWMPWWLAVMLVGCPAAESISAGTESDSTSGGASTGSAGDSGASSSLSGSHGESSDTSGLLDCEAQNPEFGCAPIDCSDPDDAHECGAHHVFDDDGCMRPWCDDDDMADACAADEICFRPGDCEPDFPCEIQNCWTDEEVCVCDPVERCAPTYGWCIPADANPC